MVTQLFPFNRGYDIEIDKTADEAGSIEYWKKYGLKLTKMKGLLGIMLEESQ